MEEQILGLINSRITSHKDIIAKVSPLIFLLGGIIFIIASIRDRDLFFTPADYERWSHRWSFRQVSLTRGRMTARVYAFITGVFIVVVSVVLAYLVYLIYYGSSS